MPRKKIEAPSRLAYLQIYPSTTGFGQEQNIKSVIRLCVRYALELVVVVASNQAHAKTSKSTHVPSTRTFVLDVPFNISLSNSARCSGVTGYVLFGLKPITATTCLYLVGDKRHMHSLVRNAKL